MWHLAGWHTFLLVLHHHEKTYPALSSFFLSVELLTHSLWKHPSQKSLFHPFRKTPPTTTTTTTMANHYWRSNSLLRDKGDKLARLQEKEKEEKEKAADRFVLDGVKVQTKINHLVRGAKMLFHMDFRCFTWISVCVRVLMLLSCV